MRLWRQLLRVWRAATRSATDGRGGGAYAKARSAGKKDGESASGVGGKATSYRANGRNVAAGGVRMQHSQGNDDLENTAAIGSMLM